MLQRLFVRDTVPLSKRFQGCYCKLRVGQWVRLEGPNVSQPRTGQIIEYVRTIHGFKCDMFRVRWLDDTVQLLGHFNLHPTMVDVRYLTEIS